MDDIKILLGDANGLIKGLHDKSVDYTFTSPPYNRKRNDKYALYDDTIKDYYGFLVGITDEMLRVTKNHVIINLQKNYYNKHDVFQYIGHYSKQIVEIIVWEKSNPLPANGFNITNAYEFFIVLGDKPLKANFTYTKNHITTTVNGMMPKNHRAVMKPEVCEWFIANFTQKNDLVLDPFFGVGTTGIICKKLNRRCIGFEIVEDYYKMACESVGVDA